MRLGAEFLELTTAAFESWAALNPTICKVRRGVFDAGAYVWVNARMRRYNSNPVFLLRSRTEVPDLHELQETLDEQLPMILGGGTEVWIEVMNEPNHPDTRTGLGDTLAEQVETYRSLLRQVVTGLRQSHPRVKLVAPGLMPEPGGISAWMVEERRLFDLDGFHLYGSGLEGLMLPARFYALPVATEVGTPFPDRRVERIIEMMAYCWRNWQPGAFVYFAVPSWTGPTGEHYDLPIEDAEDYANWHIELHREEKPPMVILLECAIEPERIAEGGSGAIIAGVYVDGHPQPGAAVAGKIMFPRQEQAFNSLTGDDGTVTILFVCRDTQPLVPGTKIEVEVWAIWSGEGISKTISFRVGGETVPDDYDPQIIMDYWTSQPWDMPRGPDGKPLGYNEDDAFGVFLSKYAGTRVGAQKCPDLELGGYLFRFYAAGILYCKVGDWSNVRVAYGIRELPPKA